MAEELYHKLSALVLCFELGGIKLYLPGSFASELTSFEEIRGSESQGFACLFLDICFHNINCIALIVICKSLRYTYYYLLSVKRLRI